MRWAVVAALALAGCPGGPTDTDDTDDTDAPTDRVAAILALTGEVASGEDLFPSNCVACHPSDGSQGTGAALSVVVPASTDDELAHTILNGAPSMPDFDYLDDQEIADLMAFLRSEFD